MFARNTAEVFLSFCLILSLFTEFLLYYFWEKAAAEAEPLIQVLFVLWLKTKFLQNDVPLSGFSF